MHPSRFGDALHLEGIAVYEHAIVVFCLVERDVLVFDIAYDLFGRTIQWIAKSATNYGDKPNDIPFIQKKSGILL